MTRIRLPLLIACLTTALTTVESQASDLVRDSVEAHARAFVTSTGSPGVAVGVWKNGKVLYSGGFGVMAVDNAKPVTSRTVFHLASISKTFVATAVMQLVEQGKVRLDDPVVKYVPDFRLSDPRFATITVRQVLTHTAGLPDVTDYAWDSPEYDDRALERWIRGLADSTLIAEPGTKWQYSNIGFEVLAYLVEKVSGESFEAYVQRRILTPAGMSHSTFLMTDVDSVNLATGHQRVRGLQARQGYPYNRRHAGSSTLHSNVEDMLRYGALNVDKGIIDKKRILQSTTYDELWKPGYDLANFYVAKVMHTRLTSTRPITSARMGLGWFVFDFSGDRVVNHDGGDRGFRSSLLVAPENRIVVIVMVNSANDASALALTLLDLARGARRGAAAK